MGEVLGGDGVDAHCTRFKISKHSKTNNKLSLKDG
jgi:hypothetical protein